MLKGQGDKESSLAVHHAWMVKGVFSDRFYGENSLVAVLKRKGKGDLYRETERNRYIHTGPNFVNVL